MQINCKKITKLIFKERWDQISEIISEETSPLSVILENGNTDKPFTGVIWKTVERNKSVFIFNQSMPHDRYQFFVTRLILLLPLIQYFHQSSHYYNGSIFINLDDSADAEGLAFCSNHEHQILIPDVEFINSQGYAKTKEDFFHHEILWQERKSIAFWRGSTTGVRKGDSWKSLPRVKLAEICSEVGHKDLFDVGISSLAQVSSVEGRQLKRAGLIKSFSPISSINRYKYQIDIDGNTNAWSALFQKLLSKSAVLKVDSPHHYRQWFYPKLVPWKNFVPVCSDMSDLVEKLLWLKNNDDKAESIGIAGYNLASSLTYEHELEEASRVIGEAFLAK